MSANIEAKKQVCAEIEEKIKASKSVVFVSYKGLTVAEDTELRREFRKNNIEYKVLKNTLVRRAFNDLGVKDFDEDLNGPTSVAFGADETGAAKVVMEAVKKYDKKVSVKSAYFEEKRLDEKGVKALAAIPSKQQLYAMLAIALLGVPIALAIALNQVAEKKETITKLQNGKAGYVYVISNLGSFGDHVFKVGMTRRKEWQERIDELGNASVPFSFDVHSVIFSDDAVGLETEMHHRLNEKRVNKVNLRKEFFDVTLDEIENMVHDIQPTAEFNRTMAAEQYRQSLSMSGSFVSFEEEVENIENDDD